MKIISLVFVIFSLAANVCLGQTQNAPAFKGKLDKNLTIPVMSNGKTYNLTGDVLAKDTTKITPQMFGAKGDGISDDAPAFQKMFDYALLSGKNIDLKSGHYLIKTTIQIKNVTGVSKKLPSVSGDGTETAVIIGDMSDSCVINIDGSSNTIYKFFENAEWSDFTITQKDTSQHNYGIKANGLWRTNFTNVRLIRLKTGFYAPQRPDLDNNPDAYGVVLLKFDHCEFEFNTQWGIYIDMGPEGPFTFIASTIKDNKIGGGHFSGNSILFQQGSIASNGNPETGGYGLVFARDLGSNPMGIKISGVEFDGNYTGHIFFNAMMTGDISYNRFISHELVNTWKDNRNHPYVCVEMGDSLKYAVKNLTFTSNYIRSDNIFHSPLVGFKINDANAGVFCKIIDNDFSNNTDSLTKFVGYNISAPTVRPYIKDFAKIVQDPNNTSVSITGGSVIQSDTTNKPTIVLRKQSNQTAPLLKFVDDKGKQVSFIGPDGTLTTTQLNLSALNTAPSSSSAPGKPGEIRVTADFIYVCIKPNSWVRAALTKW